MKIISSTKFLIISSTKFLNSLFRFFFPFVLFLHLYSQSNDAQAFSAAISYKPIHYSVVYACQNKTIKKSQYIFDCIHVYIVQKPNFRFGSR